MIMTRNRRAQMGFTMIELLVVIAILGILAGLLTPAVLYGKFKARVTTCTNNYRQLALAAALYARDDSKGRLPSFLLPTESSQLVNFRNLYPWLIGLPTLKAMETHGIPPQMWYCPLRKRWQDNSTTFQAAFGSHGSTTWTRVGQNILWYWAAPMRSQAFLSLRKPRIVRCTGISASQKCSLVWLT